MVDDRPLNPTQCPGDGWPRVLPAPPPRAASAPWTVHSRCCRRHHLPTRSEGAGRPAARMRGRRPARAAQSRGRFPCPSSSCQCSVAARCRRCHAARCRCRRCCCRHPGSESRPLPHCRRRRHQGAARRTPRTSERQVRWIACMRRMASTARSRRALPPQPPPLAASTRPARRPRQGWRGSLRATTSARHGDRRLGTAPQGRPAAGEGPAQPFVHGTPVQASPHVGSPPKPL
mmetsp:Transcript_22772/g.67796  ORF Transcript_22772/g.67796 Transcript_22772/m.67796 type:complete len:232 (+) Transcript_22772:798-1493(+)